MPSKMSSIAREYSLRSRSSRMKADVTFDKGSQWGPAPPLPVSGPTLSVVDNQTGQETVVLKPLTKSKSPNNFNGVNAYISLETVDGLKSVNPSDPQSPRSNGAMVVHHSGRDVPPLTALTTTGEFDAMEPVVVHRPPTIPSLCRSVIFHVIVGLLALLLLATAFRILSEWNDREAALENQRASMMPYVTTICDVPTLYAVLPQEAKAKCEQEWVFLKNCCRRRALDEVIAAYFGWFRDSTYNAAWFVAVVSLVALGLILRAPQSAVTSTEHILMELLRYLTATKVSKASAIPSATTIPRSTSA